MTRAVALLGLTALAAFGSARTALAQSVPDQIRAEVHRLVAAINRKDAAAAAALYLDQPGTATLGDGQIARGAVGVRQVFEQILAQAGPVELVVEDSIEVVPLGRDAALAFFRCRWVHGDPRPVRGAMTIVLARTPQGWRIVHDHTSTLLGADDATSVGLPMNDAGPPSPARETRSCAVTRIVDGDTIECRGVGRIRLIGIDTPELSQAPYGTKAAQTLAALIPPGTTVEVERDVEPSDRYGRALGYVWHRGAMVNWTMIRQGWALLLTYPPNVQHVDWLTDAQRRAREERRGLWAVDGFACPPAERRRGRC